MCQMNNEGWNNNLGFRFLIMVRIRHSSLLLGIFFICIFPRTHSMQSICSCIQWLNLGLCSRCISFFLLSIFAYKKSLSLSESLATRKLKVRDNKDQDIIAISKCPSEKTHVILTDYPSLYYLQRQNSFDTTTTMSYKLFNRTTWFDK